MFSDIDEHIWNKFSSLHVLMVIDVSFSANFAPRFIVMGTDTLSFLVSPTTL